MFPRTTVLIGFTLAAAAFAISAGATTLPIAAGDYVRAGVQCRGAPNAALLTYDGQNFTGAHSSDCTTTVLNASGRRYALRSTCRAAGDGSSAKSYTETQSVTVQSASRFIFGHAAGAGRMDRAEYRLCANPQY